MNTTANFARNKTTLAQCLGCSRTLLYEYLKLPEAPVPRNDGRWSVPAMRKFMASHAKQIKAPNEREALQIQLLRLKAEREAHELAKSRDEIREQIRDEYHQLFTRAMSTFIAELRRMVGELSPRFDSMSAREIYRVWGQRQQEAFDRVRLTFRGDKAPAVSKNNHNGTVIPFGKVA